jgi:hypothetical protein
MLLIQNLTDDPLQDMTLVLPDGTQLFMEIYFRQYQQGWFINEITYGSTFSVAGLRISNNSNILRQWKNSIPFGLACYSTANREPSLIQDFSSGNSKLYVLTAAEVAQYEVFLSGGSP